MGFPESYFMPLPGCPMPLVAITERMVRFEEIDSIGMVWHGRYPSFLEDGRAEFGRRYGLGYSRFRDAGMAAPIVHMQIDYRTPLRLDDSFSIETILHWTDSLKLNFEYRIRRDSHELAATACTIQLVTDASGSLILAETGFLREFREKWRTGVLHDA